MAFWSLPNRLHLSIYFLVIFVQLVHILAENITLQNCCYQEQGVSCEENISVDWNILKSLQSPQALNYKDRKIVSIDESTLVVKQNFQAVLPQQVVHKLLMRLEPICDSYLIFNKNFCSRTRNSLECGGDIYTRYEAKTSLNLSVSSQVKATFLFSEDGHFQFDSHIFQPSQFCIHTISLESIAILTCPRNNGQCLPSSSSGKINFSNVSCPVRCCNYGEVWDLGSEDGKFRCRDSGKHKWKAKVYPDLYSGNVCSTSGNEGQSGSDLAINIVNHPKSLVKGACSVNPYTFQIHGSNKKLHGRKHLSGKVGKRPFKVLKDGSVWINVRKREWIQLEPGEYCIDGFQYGEGKYSGDNSDSLLFECKKFDKNEEGGKEHQRKYSLVFGILLFTCLCFLLMTTLVYILLWSKHNIHGWTVFSYIVSLLGAYLSLGISHFTTISLTREPGERLWTFCGMLGVTCHFTLLAVFSSSTVLNYDLWETFRNLRPSRKSKGLKKFVAYFSFTLMVPASIVTTGVLLDIAYSGDDCYDDVITPGYGRSVCYVEPREARFYFVIIPTAVLLGINFVFFFNTALSVHKVKKSTQFASSSSTKIETNNQTFRLILKLFLVNGTIWIVEIISWYLQTDYEELGIVSFVLDVINISQAIAIFFIFVFKNDILDALKRNYPKLEGTVNMALKLKNLGRKENLSIVRGGNTESSCKTNESNMPVSSL